MPLLLLLLHMSALLLLHMSALLLHTVCLRNSMAGRPRLAGSICTAPSSALSQCMASYHESMSHRVPHALYGYGYETAASWGLLVLCALFEPRGRGR